HGFDLALEVMALVDHVRDVGLLAALPLEEKNLVENAEDLIGVNRSEGQIIVGVAAIVKVETAEHAFREKPGDNLLDVLGRIVMTSVDQNFRLRTGKAREMECHAPIGDVRVIEGGLEGLVFDKQALTRRELVMRGTQRLFEPLLTLADVRGARVVGSVGEPQRDILRPQAASDFNAIFYVREGALPDGRIWM